ncbi:hypothetical protein HPB50_019493 [Hyalomma asiaticum]|uniref:Uncharacterized protein n=1 Tax=Hyalomma asiaticum TaxID=266040 RepID=A0ACB7SJ84_HYAAI|nr:hypothetical protein HPB50_019493 [Hyalomma asiaticum]
MVADYREAENESLKEHPVVITISGDGLNSAESTGRGEDDAREERQICYRIGIKIYGYGNVAGTVYTASFMWPAADTHAALAMGATLEGIGGDDQKLRERNHTHTHVHDDHET